MTTTLVIIASIIFFIYYCINRNFRNIFNFILKTVLKIVLNIFILPFYRLAYQNILNFLQPISRQNILDYLSTSAIVTVLILFQFWHVAILVSSLILIPLAVGKVLKHDQSKNATINNQIDTQSKNIIQPVAHFEEPQESTMSNDFLMPDFSHMTDDQVLAQVGYIPKPRKFASFTKKAPSVKEVALTLEDLNK